jgi:twinkle protein
VSIVPDSFAFSQYVSAVKGSADVVRAGKIDLVDAFYGERVKGDPMPWPKTTDLITFRPGEVTLWPGISSHGKSLVLNQVAFHLAMLGKKIAIASLEMPPASTLARAARQMAGCERPTESYLKGFQNWANDRVFLMGTLGIVPPSRVLDFLRFCADRHGCTHLIVDNLTKVIRDETDAASMKSFVDDLCSVAKDHKAHVHLVAHTRKTESEYSFPDKFDVRGSQSTVDQVDNVIVVFRHKKKEDVMVKEKDLVKRGEWESKPDAFLIVNKQRHFEWEGTVGLYLHRASMSFVERPKQPHPLPHLFDMNQPAGVAEAAAEEVDW